MTIRIVRLGSPRAVDEGTRLGTVRRPPRGVPRADFAAMAGSDKFEKSEFARQEGTPYGMRREVLLSPLGIPCTAPPWGTLTAVDMRAVRPSRLRAARAGPRAGRSARR